MNKKLKKFQQGAHKSQIFLFLQFVFNNFASHIDGDNAEMYRIFYDFNDK